MGIFYKDKPVFGFDIGRSSIKVMQIDQSGKKSHVTAYGSAGFKEEAIDKGVVVDHEEIIKNAHRLLTQELVGNVSTNRVAVSLPNEHSFSRVITLPKMDQTDLRTAVQLEVDQSIPVPIDELYYDHAVVRQLDDGTMEVQVVACPKDIVDSYMGIFEALGLEVALLESNISAVTRMVVQAEAHDVPTLIVDVGSTACDLSVYDGNTIRATGTVDCSGEILTQNIAKALSVSTAQANSIKTRYGLDSSKKQKEILEAVEPELSKLIY
jgi:type IV pilus assembly protein PilM